MPGDRLLNSHLAWKSLPKRIQRSLLRALSEGTTQIDELEEQIGIVVAQGEEMRRQIEAFQETDG